MVHAIRPRCGFGFGFITLLGVHDGSANQLRTHTKVLLLTVRQGEGVAL